MDREALAALYARACATPSDINGHLPFMHDLVRSLNAAHVIELGTRSGVSTAAWLYGLSFTGGRLTSVDLEPAPAALGTWPHWRHVVGDDTAPAVLAQLEPADVVFIDTSHTYEHTRLELAIYRHLVKPGGALVLHDMALEHPLDAPPFPPFPVRRAVAEFCRAEGLAYVERPGWWGLGVIYPNGASEVAA